MWCAPTGEQLRHEVAERGWSVVRIFPERRRPAWAFTVGLWHSYRSPEVAIFGLDLDVLGPALDVLAEECAAGRPLVAGEQRTGVLEGFPIELGSIHRDWYNTFFGTAAGFYRRTRGITVLQVVWPDLDGRFPRQPNAARWCRRDQPRLSVAPPAHTRNIWTRGVTH